MRYFFATIATLIETYSFLCFLRIILTWIPGASYSRFGSFLSSICDPFLNIFSGIRWMRIGNLNFSPAIAIGLLYALSSIMNGLAATGYLNLNVVTVNLIRVIWSIVISVLGFVFILLIIRFIAIL